MNERMSSTPRQLSEVEKSLMEIKGELKDVPELKAEEVKDYEDSAEGLIEEIKRDSLESAEAEEEWRKKIAAAKTKEDYESFREPDDSVDVDLSDLDKAA